MEPSGWCLGSSDGKCYLAQGKTLGGGSAVNLLYYFRGNKRDFDRWAELGNEGWDFNSVLPFYQQNEKLTSPDRNSTYGENGPVSLKQYSTADPLRDVLLAAAAEKGYPFINYEGEGLGYFDSLLDVGDGVRQSAGRVFLGSVKNRSNLHVALDALVEKIVINDDKNATGVLVTINNQILNIRASKEVIVSAGTVNTPKLLKLSGIGNRTELESFNISFVKDLAVGENYQDHPAVAGYFVKLKPGLVDPTSLDAYYYVGGIPTYCSHRDGPLATTGFNNFNAFINTYNNNTPYPNIQVFHLLFPIGSVKLPTFLESIKYDATVIAALQIVNVQSDLLLIIPSLLNPISRGRVTLKSSNAKDEPATVYNVFDEPEDLETVLSAVKYLESFRQTEAFGNPELVKLPLPACDVFVYRSDDYWRCFIRYTSRSLLHLAGTAKMGPENDTEAVVDNRLRVYGIGNLRVIDNSIMPLVTSANTNGPAMMIGRKGATMVAEDWS